VDHIEELGVTPASIDGLCDKTFIALSIGFPLRCEFADFMTVGGSGSFLLLFAGLLSFLFAGLEEIVYFFIL
jgi:hypothetical protein